MPQGPKPRPEDGASTAEGSSAALGWASARSRTVLNGPRAVRAAVETPPVTLLADTARLAPEPSLPDEDTLPGRGNRFWESGGKGSSSGAGEPSVWVSPALWSPSVSPVSPSGVLSLVGVSPSALADTACLRAKAARFRGAWLASLGRSLEQSGRHSCYRRHGHC